MFRRLTEDGHQYTGRREAQWIGSTNRVGESVTHHSLTQTHADRTQNDTRLVHRVRSTSTRPAMELFHQVILY